MLLQLTVLAIANCIKNIVLELLSDALGKVTKKVSTITQSQFFVIDAFVVLVDVFVGVFCFSAVLVVAVLLMVKVGFFVVNVAV